MTDWPNPREFTRVPISVRMELRAGDRVLRIERTRDVSLRGAYVYTDDVLPEGTACEATVLLGDQQATLTLELEAVVVRSEEHGMAIEITGMQPETYHHLRSLLLYNADDAKQVEQEFLDHVGIKTR